jgi:hypothetical protein
MSSTSTMGLEDALRVASIFEADDVISVPARACRVLAQAVKDLTNEIIDLRLEVISLQVNGASND